MVNNDQPTKEHIVNTRTKAAMALSTLALTLSACAPTPDPPSRSPQQREALFLELVRDNTDTTHTDADLIKLAKAACAAMSKGATISELGAVVAENAVNAKQRDEGAKIVGYGISQYCPEQGLASSGNGR